jgi:hypothetical protein
MLAASLSLRRVAGESLTSLGGGFVKRGVYFLLSAAVVLASVFWLLIAFRWISIPFLLLFVVALVFYRTRTRPIVRSVLWIAFFGSTLLPFDITNRTAADGPRFVSCCPGAPYRDYDDVVAKHRRGECELCSDLVFGFEPKFFLVW